MTALDPITVIFDGVAPSNAPEFVLLVGQPGAGTSRLAHEIAANTARTLASVAAENFAAFHPDFLELTRRRPFDASAVMSPQVAGWIGGTLDHARETQRSLLFETSVSNPAPALATAAAFSEAGFHTRLVIVAVRRSESLLATASRYLNARRLRLPARFTDRDSHNRGWIGVQALAREAEATAAVGRLTIVSHDGALLFDAIRDDGFAGATAVLEAVQNGPVSVLEGARWFGELRAITEFARRSREMAPPVAEVLGELHRLGLSDVLPRMPVPRNSAFAIDQEARLSSEIFALRRELPVVSPEPAIVPSGPVVAPAPSRGGPSL
jgi:UDP-N-acetylglucosamine kinase